MTDIRQRVADRLRDVVPGFPAMRIWGRAKNIPVHDSTAYLSEEDGTEPWQKRQTAFDPNSLGPEGNVWAGDPEDVAELLDKAGLLTSDGEPPLIGYMVVREVEFGGVTHRDSAGGIRSDREPVESHLAWCRVNAERERNGRGFNGRFFMAEIREVVDDV